MERQTSVDANESSNDHEQRFPAATKQLGKSEAANKESSFLAVAGRRSGGEEEEGDGTCDTQDAHQAGITIRGPIEPRVSSGSN